MSLLSRASRPIASSSTSAVCALCQVSSKRLAHKLVEVELVSDVPALGRRGDRLPVARGHARHLGSRGQALLVVNNRAASPLRDMMRRESQREAAWRTESLTKGNSALSARDVLDEMVDHRQTALERENNLIEALEQVQSLRFERLTHASSNDLFGSVTVGDIVNELKAVGIRLDESTTVALEPLEGVEKARIKQVGKFACNVTFREVHRTVRVQIDVVKASSGQSDSKAE